LVDVDLLLINYNMPKMNGIELIKKTKKYNKDLPIIIMTANHLALPEDHLADMVLPKPFNLKKLSWAIRKLIR